MTNKMNLRRQPPERSDQFSAKQDAGRYLIDFTMDPVQFPFFCGQPGSYRKFEGFGAFNDYFAKLVPDQDVSGLADVWDGYYRITLAQFDTKDDPEQLRRKFDSFRPLFVSTQVSEPPFRSSKLDVNRTHTYQLGEDFNLDPIALYVTASPKLEFEPLIAEIKKQISPTKWIPTPRNDLHMNIRLYPSENETSNGSEWTWKRVRRNGIPEKVKQHPIAFSSAMLEIIPNRGGCINSYSEKSSNEWWLGVTKLDRRCSGCKAPVGNKVWRGMCRTCGLYERIKPIWSFPFSVKASIV